MKKCDDDDDKELNNREIRIFIVSFIIIIINMSYIILNIQ